jgi:hypothetical protein
MRLTDVISLGIDRVLDLAVKNELPSGHLWVAVKGAWKYATAAARGDEAHQIAQQERLLMCKFCSAIDWADTSDKTVRAGYCGKTQTEGPNPTCGCLVAITINGRLEPAGKLRVASEHCPRDLWNAAPRAN